MAHIIGMTKLSDILQSIKAGHSHNHISASLKTHKTVIARIRKIAHANNWLSSSGTLPDDYELKAAYNSQFPSNTTVHPLDIYREEIKTWCDDGESFVVILRKLHERMGTPSLKDTRLRDYVHKNFPQLPKPIMRRDPERAVAEMDFGYLGKCADENGGQKKTWFISVRFRFSRYAYREYLLHTDIQSVISSLIRAFEYFGAVPERLVIDNFKAAVAKAHFYDPTLTQSFRDFAKHYGILIDPCKAYSPEHKGGVESDVKYVKRNFLPLLRDYEKQRGHDVIRLSVINERFQVWDETVAGKRRIREAGDRTPSELFDEEYAHLKALAHERYVIVEYAVNVMVHRDWHVRYKTVRYSVPYKYRLRSDARIRANSLVIDVFIDNELIARHTRSYSRGAKVTVKEHGPEASMEYMALAKGNVISRALEIGTSTHKIVNALLTTDGQCYLRSARAIIFLTKKYPLTAIEKACERAIEFNLKHYHEIKNILKNTTNDDQNIFVDANGQGHLMFERSGNEYKNNLKENGTWTHSHN